MKLVYTVPGSYVFPLQYAKDVKNMMIKNLTLIFLGGQKKCNLFRAENSLEDTQSHAVLDYFFYVRNPVWPEMRDS